MSERHRRGAVVADFETLELSAVGDIAVLRLDRPAARNAVDDTMRSELRTALDHIVEHQEYRGLVLTGSGSVFCAGGDIRGMQERIDQGPRAGEIGWRRQRELHESLERLYALDRPTLAAVNGPALGLGLDIALTCDFVWLSETATVASSFIKRGLIPDGGGMYHLPQRVGLSAAKDLVFSGRSVDAAEALALGIADRVLRPQDLIDQAVQYLTALAVNPATAQAMAKQVLNGALGSSLAAVNTLAGQAQAYCYNSPDHTASVRAFLESRAARKKENAS